MHSYPYLDRLEVTEAAELIRKFGDDAGCEAAARADRSRDLGNHIHFCPLAPDRAAGGADVDPACRGDGALGRRFTNRPVGKRPNFGRS
jgi:hypothetical protein